MEIETKLRKITLAGGGNYYRRHANIDTRTGNSCDK